MESFTETPSIVDLFSGCGGFSLGAELAGFHTLAAIDIDATLQHGYKKNFPNTKTIEGNVADISASDWQLLIGKNRPHGIIGGPPCQGFSRIGKRQKDDPRNNLVHHFYRHVKELRPKFFVMENVQGILDEENVDTLTNGIEQVSKYYEILGPFVINAADFGAATNRYRVLVVGYDPEEISNIDIEDFTKKHVLKHTTVREAISDLPSPTEDTKDYSDYSWAPYPNIEKTQLSSYAKKMRKTPPSGIGWPEGIKKFKQGLVSGLTETKHSEPVSQRYRDTPGGKCDPTSKSHKLRWDGLSPTLRAGTGADKGSFQAVRPLHPSEGRVITAREAARLQGFPDWFVFHPTKWHSFRMIGNSVSPLVSNGILSILMKAIKNQRNTKAA